MSRYDAMKALERTRGMMISSGDKSYTQIGELDAAMDQLASGNFVLGSYHFSLAVYADSQAQLQQNLATARAYLSNAGFVTVKEDLAVTVLQTTNGQPYYFNFHATNPGENSLGEKAIANTMVIGKSGTGKTALINFLLSQVQKLDPKPTIFFFDKDRGAEVFVRACGGNYMVTSPQKSAPVIIRKKRLN